MRPRTHAFGAALLFSFGLAPILVAVGEGRVMGTVIDEAGRPLGGEAAPLASPMGGASDDALVTLERRKWDPQAFSSRAEFVALFADDFVSVGDGIDISSGVQRKTKAEVFAGPVHPPATFELSDFRIVHPNSDAAIVSYRVTGTSFAWNAYVTSVWARRHGTWTTVFYQASPAK